MKSLTRALLALFVVCLLATPALAQGEGETEAPTVDPTQGYPGAYSAIGMGLSALGIGVGVGLIGFAALSGIARQPEQAGRIQGAMILLAALVEGAGVIAIIFCAFVIV